MINTSSQSKKYNQIQELNIQNHTSRAEYNYFDYLLWILVLSGILINVVVFFLPHNLISDEDEYLNEVLSLSAGEPEGWNIRSFFYPSILSISVLLAKIMGIVNPMDLILVARLTNWISAWIAVVLTYVIGTRLYNRQVGLLATIFLLFCWSWILNSTQLLMDVPSAMWMLLSLFFVFSGVDRDRNIILATVFGSIAVFTKFQIAPAVLLIGIMIFLSPRAKERRFRNFILCVAAAVPMITVFAVTDWIIYGQPFASIINMLKYSYNRTAEVKILWGQCPESIYYLKNLSWVYSYIFPIFLLLGFLISIYYKKAVLIIFICIAYLVPLHFVCAKDTRYLIQILPLLSIIGSYGFFWTIKKLSDFEWPEKLKEIILNIRWLLAFVAVLLIIVSFVPRSEVQEMLVLSEACGPFVYEIASEFAALPAGDSIAIAVPCETPLFPVKGYLGNHKVTYLNTGFNEFDKKRFVEKFKLEIGNYSLLILKKGTIWEKVLMSESNQCYRLFRESKKGLYAAYIRQECK